MLEMLQNLVNLLNEYLSIILIVTLVGTGIYFTFRLKFVQITNFGASFKAVFGNIKLRGDAAGADGMSSFQSLATAIAAQVGTGNIAGAATALVLGGPGAIFWMWVSAFFGMATIFVEASLAQKYKTTVDGEVTGGPAYYLRAAFPGKFGKALAGIFAVLLILALGLIGNMVQSNSIGTAFKSAFGINPLIIGIIVAIACFFIFRGGVKAIASVVEKLVPIMALVYILGSLIVIIANITELPHVLSQIFVGAFNPSAVGGGIAGVTVMKAVRYGVARGLFSNEAGMGSTPHAHAVAKVKHPCDQGLVAMMGVFIDTFIVLNMTVFVVMITGVLDYKETGIALAQKAFNATLGNFGPILIAICLFFFAFSTIIGWYFFAEQNIKYLFGKKAVPVFSILVCLFVILGSALEVELVWSMADLFNSAMVLPNLLGILGLSKVASQLYKEFNENKALKLKQANK